jgi:large subunit ribosomal protein L7/L12
MRFCLKAHVNGYIKITILNFLSLPIAMNSFKNILISLTMAAAFSSVSTAAFSKPAGQEAVTTAAETTIASLERALSLLEKGGDNEAVGKAIGTARQQQKEFRFEVTERQREKAVGLLKRAQSDLKNGNVQPAEQTLREALASFKEMKAIYDKTH